MAKYRLSDAAEADIEAIYLHTDVTFGAGQAQIYVSGLEQTFEKISDLPRMGRSADDLRPGLFRFRYQSHVIFYTIEFDHIVIRRVLHGRMDFASRL
jgi:toxin ParE1/3/4